MAIEISVNPLLSPRIIMIDGTTYDNVSAQDFYDAVRAWEDSFYGDNFPYLIDASGKEPLGEEVSVGITLKLINARILFQGELDPLDDGSGRTCDTSDSTGRQLYVDDADFVADGISVGDTVHNKTTNEWATVTEVVDQYTLNHLQLSGQGAGIWTSGDNYEVFKNVQCSLSGGNFTAVDEYGDDIEPVMQSSFVQVVRTSASSATLLEQGDVSIDADVISDTVWDEKLSEHLKPETTGYSLKVASSEDIIAPQSIAQHLDKKLNP